jgi:hypothetical protein
MISQATFIDFLYGVNVNSLAYLLVVHSLG